MPWISVRFYEMGRMGNGYLSVLLKEEWQKKALKPRAAKKNLKYASVTINAIGKADRLFMRAFQV